MHRSDDAASIVRGQSGYAHHKLYQPADQLELVSSGLLE
jgi:hypothetical protein